MTSIRLHACLAAILACITSARGQGNGYCTVTSGSDTTTPQDMLPFLPVSFRTKVEANFVHMDLTSTIQEYFDSDGNRGALSIQNNDDLLTLIYDYKTGEIFNINGDGRCVVTNITSNNFLFGDKIVDGKNHIFTSNGAMKIGGNWAEVTKNKTTIRGINVRQWETCQYWSVFNATFTVNYYFSDTEWVPSNGFSPTPVRAHVKGQIVDWPVTRDFEHYYEYFDFQLDIGDDTSVFETPKGVVCPGRKKTKKVPSLPDYYYYREEIIETQAGLIQHADVWYDHENKLLRYDYRNFEKIPPFYNTNPISEVHDYSTGVAYVTDKIEGSCYTWFLPNNSFDAAFNATAFKVNGSFALHMKNPMKLFYLDDTYTYEGQTTVRGAMCDRFISARTDFLIPGAGNMGKVNSTFTYYFLSSNFNEITNTGVDQSTQMPFRLEITTNGGFEAVYNFLDFDTDRPPFSVYDVKSCYAEENRLKIKMRFPVSYSIEAAEVLRLESQIQLAEVMQISPIRLQDVVLDYDNADMYVTVTILGPPPPGAEFTFIPKKEIVKEDDKTIPDVTDPNQCAQYCVEETDFTCKSYDLCKSDKSCRLSKAHIDDGKAVLVDSKCNHFSRTVDGSYSPQTPLLDAYGVLSQAVYNREYTMEVPLIENGQTVPIQAVEVQIVYGHLFKSDVPSITGQYFYRQEIAIPQVNLVEQANVWYDSAYKLVRFDKRETTAKPPFYSTNPMSFIHDFNTGIQYSIDKLLGNCSMSAIQNDTFDTAANLSLKLRDGSFVSRMKNPLELFYLDSSYKPAGQRTVRGVLCDVFEATRTDFRLPGIDMQLNTTFQYFFLADSWSELSDSTRSSDQDVPIRLDIVSPSVGFLATYSFFDFDEQHPDLKNFDVGACYNDDKKIRFQVQFNNTYHPYLDSTRAYFEMAVRLTMASDLEITTLRIQDSRIDYDEKSVYYTATLLDRAPPSAQYVLTAGTRSQFKDDKQVKGVTNPDQCAVYCSQESTFPCNSFDWCPNTQTCALSKRHVSEGQLQEEKACLHFSRDVNAPTKVEIELSESWDALRDIVYKAAFTVKIPYGNKLYPFTAVSIKDILFTDGPAVLQEENNIKKFKVQSTNTAIKVPKTRLPKLSVDDCATACIAEETFSCEGFDYCFSDGDCFLTDRHPDSVPANSTTLTSLCDLYARNYVDDFTVTPGNTVLQTGAKTVTSVSTPNDCARLCERETGFVCKSFDFCGQLQRCVLGKKHVFDIPVSDVEVNPQCSHYSRRYVDDFKLSLGKMIVFKDNYIINGVSGEECAKLCVEEESFSCKSFDFCANTTQCRLSSANLDGIGQVTIQDSAYCNHYTRQYFPNGTKYNSKPHKQYNPPNNKEPTGYSAGTLAGVSIGMAALGAIIALVIFAIFQKKRHSTSDSFTPTVNFTRHIDE
ncbi:uncharacterized protein LOC135471299 [Liolophura sinensis]|uniref:uncharacterized protein LOC135471299 n=1 Tax=Liolophura sinensis TaxID=3198878 RepID=UPI003158DBBF